jgi:hypothetical protein
MRLQVVGCATSVDAVCPAYLEVRHNHPAARGQDAQHLGDGTGGVGEVTHGPGPAGATEEDVVASAVLSSLSALQPAAGAVRRLSRTTRFISHRTTTRMVPPHDSLGYRASASSGSLLRSASISASEHDWQGATCE